MKRILLITLLLLPFLSWEQDNDKRGNFDIAVKKRAYIGPNVSIGAFTNSKRIDLPWDFNDSYSMFSSVGWNLAFQINVGWRF